MVRKRQGVAALTLGSGSVILGVTAAALGLPVLGLPALVAGAAAATLGPLVMVAWHEWLRLSDTRQRAILEALADALRELDPELGPLVLEAGEARVQGPPHSSKRFAEAAAELLGPVRYPRYLLLEPDGSVWPVPGELAARRDLADGFGACWAALVGPCELLYARQGRGKELLRAAWKVGGREEVEVVEGWE